MIGGIVYGAIGLAMISSIACAEDLSAATAPLPLGTFTTSAHSDEWKIANALSAGPASITEHAAVMDWPANPKDGMSHTRVLRQGTNGWTCMPDVSGRPQHDPMCVDETMMKWLMATLAGKKPDIDRVGLSYMLMGEARHQSSQKQEPSVPVRRSSGGFQNQCLAPFPTRDFALLTNLDEDRGALAFSESFHGGTSWP